MSQVFFSAIWVQIHKYKTDSGKKYSMWKWQIIKRKMEILRMACCYDQQLLVKIAWTGSQDLTLCYW